MLKARLPDLGLEKVEDRRRRQGRRWRLPVLLRAVLVGLASGRKSLAEVEQLTDEMSQPIREMLGISRRIADTTLRDALVRLHPSELRAAIHRMMQAARRRKALVLQGFPFHVAALDGKAVPLSVWEHHYAQQHAHEETGVAYGLVRTVTAALVSTLTKPILDAVPIPAETNEMGIFPVAFEALMRAYGNLVRLVTYDAGVTSQAHCRLVVDAGKDFLFSIKNENWLVMQEAKRLLAAIPTGIAKAHTEDVLANGTTLHRYLFPCAVVGKSFFGWPQVKTILRVHSERVRDGQVVASEDRYFISSLRVTELTADQWLSLVRHHWAVEICHWTLDAIFREDEHPWIETDPRGALVFMLLRRIAYNLLALFRSVTQRSDEQRAMPWRQLLRWLYNTLIAATRDQLLGLRSRPEVAVRS